VDRLSRAGGAANMRSSSRDLRFVVLQAGRIVAHGLEWGSGLVWALGPAISDFPQCYMGLGTVRLIYRTPTSLFLQRNTGRRSGIDQML
jgi:hypothetical protein